MIVKKKLIEYLIGDLEGYVEDSLVFNQEVKRQYESGNITDNDINSALMSRLEKSAWTMYEETVDGEYADHVSIPEALAYGLEIELFSAEEIERINFDDGENPESYIRMYGGKNLLFNIRDEILNPKPTK